ncbi:MAG: leucine-rich repeat domain-containing protein [Clostridia bacterium]|nr:leucine-rich repeat domain-containing protein [Clostridia bacterium]
MKKLFTLILSIILCFSSFILTSCGPTGPVYSEEYDYDEEHHWRPLLEGSETDPTYTDYGEHVNKKGKCVCGYYFECPYLAYKLNRNGNGLICYGAADLDNGYYYEYSNGEEYHSYEDKNGVDSISTYNWVHVEVPKYAEYEGTSYPVVELASYAFTSELVESIKLNEGLKSIGTEAFSYTPRLKEVRIPDSVNSVGTSLFFQSNGIETVYLGENVPLIRSYNFYKCSNLKRVYTNKNLKAIYAVAFYNCTSLEYIVIPESCVEMDNIGPASPATTYPPFLETNRKATIYLEHESAPAGFAHDWNIMGIKCYWKGQWAYDANGEPYAL